MGVDKEQMSQLETRVKMKNLASTLSMIVININGQNTSNQMQRLPNQSISSYMMPPKIILTVGDRKTKEKIPQVNINQNKAWMLIINSR